MKLSVAISSLFWALSSKLDFFAKSLGQLFEHDNTSFGSGALWLHLHVACFVRLRDDFPVDPHVSCSYIYRIFDGHLR